MAVGREEAVLPGVPTAQPRRSQRHGNTGAKATRLSGLPVDGGSSPPTSLFSGPCVIVTKQQHHTLASDYEYRGEAAGQHPKFARGYSVPSSADLSFQQAIHVGHQGGLKRPSNQPSSPTWGLDVTDDVYVRGK